MSSRPETQAPVNLTYGRARLSDISRLSRSSRSSRGSHRDRSTRRSQGARLTQHATRSTVMSQMGDLGDSLTDSGPLAAEHRGTIIADQHRGTVMSFAGEHRGTVMAPANQRGTVMSFAGEHRGTVVGENRGTVMTLGIPDRLFTKVGGTRASRASQASRFSMVSKQLGTVEFVWFTAVAFVPIF